MNGKSGNDPGTSSGIQFHELTGLRPTQLQRLLTDPTAVGTARSMPDAATCRVMPPAGNCRVMPNACRVTGDAATCRVMPVALGPGRSGEAGNCRVMPVALGPDSRGDALICRVRQVSPWRIMPGGSR
jgi:hypothetical protein